MNAFVGAQNIMSARIIIFPEIIMIVHIYHLG